MKITFIGATKDVTGSMTLLENSAGKILIDCGLYQGPNEVVKKNLLPLPFNPKNIDAIILTHAHLDHSGLIPRLTRVGFRGQIFCTKPTMKLAHIIMADSAHIMERNEHHLLNGFYESPDVVVATSLFKTKKLHAPFDVLGMTVTFQSSGHILGAVSVHIVDGADSAVFSGDLGRSNDPMNFPPEACPKAKTIVMESTYGGKVRSGNMHVELINFLKKIKAESKVGIIASFAVARAQLLITLIQQFYKDHPEEKVRMIIDGPMMTEANKIYKEFSDLTRMPEELRNALEDLDIIDHVSEWNSIRKKDGPLIIISSSGMIAGGRIWRYIENWQNDKSAVVFLPGYQAEGTPGKELSIGNRNIQSEDGTPIHWSGEIVSSSAFSSHADQNELMAWLTNVDKETKIFLIHGEYESKLALKKKLLELGYKNCIIPES